MAININWYYRWEPLEISGNLQAPLVCNEWTANNMFLAMNQAYGGPDIENYKCFTGPNGPMTLTVSYELPGFTHNYENADPKKEFDRIVMTDNQIYFAWNFLWAYSYFSRSEVIMTRSYWYFCPHPGRGYDYLGQLVVIGNQGYPADINTVATADPHPPPTLPL